MNKKASEFIDPNVPRKGKLLEGHLIKQGTKDFPWFSIIEFNLCGLCNRKCVFCPRHDPKIFPNINEHMPAKVYEKIMADLQKINFNGTILYSGFGEPLLYKNLQEVVKLSKKYCPKARVEIVTNGDLITVENVSQLFKNGLTTLCISMYDGLHQVERFEKLKNAVSLKDDQLILRTRWLPPEEHFGITLSNRAGAMEMKEVGMKKLTQPLKRACYYPFYQIFIDYDGSVLLCSHDWNEKLVVGSVRDQSILEIWHSPVLKQVRMKLAKEDRNFSPCNLCDVKGTLMGSDHFNKFIKYYDKQ